jgi:hypothetical protein
MQKPVGEGMWEDQYRDGWMKLTQCWANVNKNVAEKSFRQRRMKLLMEAKTA